MASRHRQPKTPSGPRSSCAGGTPAEPGRAATRRAPDGKGAPADMRPLRLVEMAALILALLSFLQAQLVARGTFGPDFYHYWLVPQVVGSAGTNIYASESRRRIGLAHLEAARREHPATKQERAALWNS